MKMFKYGYILGLLFSVCYGQKKPLLPKEIGLSAGVVTLPVYDTRSSNTQNLNHMIMEPSLYVGVVYEHPLKSSLLWVSKIGFIDVNYHFEDPLHLIDQRLISRKHNTLYSGLYYPFQITKHFKNKIGIGFDYHIVKVNEYDYYTNGSITTPVFHFEYKDDEGGLVLTLGAKKAILPRLTLSADASVHLFFGVEDGSISSTTLLAQLGYTF
ncbi:MAG: hypothetical protein JNN12_10085 [Bacteroidetes Order II. Incertae sedis bacterium]|nr:hypothetical protein [Bacteroidetes Order II. bacterium]